MLEIAFIRGSMDTVKDFTDYEVDGDNKVFFVYNGKQVVGLYNLEQVLYIKFIKED